MRKFAVVGWESWDRSRRGGEARAEVRGLEERVVLVLNLDLRKKIAMPLRGRPQLGRGWTATVLRFQK